MPWIPEHGDALVTKIARSGEVRFHPLDIVRDSDNVADRLAVLGFVQKSPEKWRRLVMRKLAPLAGSVDGFVVSFDWHPVMREIVHACRALGIPTVLVPHESVFIDEERYYVARNGANVPVTDYALVWGEMQRRIFTGRGYPADRLVVTGSPKFDVFHRYRPLLDREAYASIFSLDPTRPILLFAGQPLDSQVDSQSYALARQSQAIIDLLDVAESIGAQVLIRQPPARRTIVFEKEVERINRSEDFAVDGPVKFLVPPEEAIFHADVVLSINSTMLFEAVLMGRPSVSMPYFAFEQIWENLDIARAPDKDALREQVAAALASRRPTVSERGMAWADRELAAGRFDGAAAERVSRELARIARRTGGARPRGPVPTETVERAGGRGSIAIASNAEAARIFGAQLKSGLGLRNLVGPEATVTAGGADLALRLDHRYRDVDPGYHGCRRALGRRELFVERGFLASPRGGARPISLVLDDAAPFFDALRESGLARRLNADTAFGDAELARAEAVVARLAGSRAASAPSGPVRRVLVVDQPANDRSVERGRASPTAFQAMLKHVLATRPQAEIAILAAGETGTTETASILSDDLVRATAGGRSVVRLPALAPAALPVGFDEIHVVTSDVGLLGVLAGVPVHCHGAAWYAGWGFTTDHVEVPFRRRARTPVEVFHVAWIACSRYFDPDTWRPCEIEDLLPGGAAAETPAGTARISAASAV